MSEAAEQVSFDVTIAERRVIQEIARRAAKIARGYGRKRPILEFAMDVTATHANGNPLRLDALRDADDFNFAHDVFGIERHLDRSTGELLDCFRPRYSAPALAEARS